MILLFLFLTVLFLPDLFLHIFQNRYDFFFIAGFQYVMTDTIFHCLAGVLIFSVSGQHNDAYVRKIFRNLSNQGNSIHDRHLYIRQYDVRLIFLDLFKGVQTIPRCSGQFDVVFFPGNKFRHSFSLNLFIIHNHQFIHDLLPQFSSVYLFPHGFPCRFHCLFEKYFCCHPFPDVPGYFSVRCRVLLPDMQSF